MKVNAAFALADAVTDLKPDTIIPAALDKTVVAHVAKAVAETALLYNPTSV